MGKVSNKTNVDRYIQQMIKDLKCRELKKNEIISRPDYIIWLQEFTKKFSQFSDYEFVYDRKKITAKDFEKVNNCYSLD